MEPLGRLCIHAAFMLPKAHILHTNCKTLLGILLIIVFFQPLRAAIQTISTTPEHSITFSATCGGTRPFTYQWYKNGKPLYGATGPKLHIGRLRTGHSGDYTLRINNPIGKVSSDIYRLKVSRTPTAPTILKQPISGEINEGASIRFIVKAAGSLPMSYQWYKNGVPITGATQSSYTLLYTTASDSGLFSVRLRNTAGAKLSRSAKLKVLRPPALALPKTLGVMVAAADGRAGVHKMSAGMLSLENATHSLSFRIDGVSAQKCLIRAMGPSLVQLGVSNPLVDPVLQLYAVRNGKHILVAANNDWLESPELAQALVQTGSVPFPARSKDSAMLMTLPPGEYLAQASSEADDIGLVLLELHTVASSALPDNETR